MYGFLRTPRWIALSILVIVVIPAFFALARWQWTRYEDRNARNTVVAGNEALGTVALESTVSPGGTLPTALEWRVVSVRGMYDAAGERYSRRQPLNGTSGFFILTPLLTEDGRAVLINRGWTPALGDARATPSVEPPPTGPVSLEGRLRVGDSNLTQPSDLPARQVVGVDSAAILSSTGRSAYPGYLELTAQQPQPDPALSALPAPELDEGPHRSYAAQWVLFSLIAVVGWAVLVRNEARRRLEESAGVLVSPGMGGDGPAH